MIRIEPGPITNEFVECLSQQLSELDLLKSMYPNHDEIIVTSKDIIDEINNVIKGDSECLPNNLEYVINLSINHLKMEICALLPITYPIEEPDIYIRCNQLIPQQESKLNAELSEYIKNNHVGEVCLYNAISWIQDNIDIIAKTQIMKPVESENNSVTVNKCSPEIVQFTRLWIYSHHIYNKKKREEIIQKCKELNLTGFCLPGKPGIICVEGDDNACKTFWRDIKSLTWKKIVIRKTETFKCNEISSFKKFCNFEELRFETQATTKHANMREFSRFMHSYDLDDIFKELFGFHELCK